jgi:microcystin-dependent protein
MSSPFVAEIRCVGFNFPPTGWAFCNGQLLPISQNTALFSLLGTYYGGDGKSTFALPNIQGNMVLGQGQGQGLSDYFLGQESGAPFVTLLQSEIPVHNHLVEAVPDPADQTTPQNNRSLARSKPGNVYQSTTNQNIVTMDPNSTSVAGGSQPHNNQQPFLVMNFIIAMQGVFPPRG